jgi:two-component system NtrC family sensor kinase
VLEHVITEVRISLEADGASILLYDKETDELVFGACAGVGSGDLPGLRMPASEGLAGWVLQNAQPLLVDDAQDDPRFYGDMDTVTSITTRSLLAVPLIYKGYVIGVIQALNRTRVHFSEAQLEMVSALAGPAAIAIENSRLYQETAQRLAETEMLHDTIMAAASTLDFEEMLSRSLHAIQRTLRVQHLALMLPDEIQEHLVIDPELIIGYQPLPDIGVKLPIAGSVAGKVYRTGRPELITDTSRIAEFFRHESLTEMRSEIAVPVRVGNWVIGVLVGLSPKLGAFDDDDLRIFEAIAAQLAIVMEHSRLFEAEREQRKLLAQSQAQLIQSEKLAATGRLAASLAHEINNPLQAIRSGLQLMLDEDNAIDHRPYLEMADEEVERLVRLVSQMLDFAGRPQSEFRSFDLNELLEEVLMLTGKYLQHSHVALTRDFTPKPTAVWGAPDELQQVFLNLLLNAVDAMPEGGTLHISTRQHGDGVRATLTDTGLGIAPEHLNNIFEPFFSTKDDGTGLGLSISHQIIERHRGQISVQSRPDDGTTFSVWLPTLPAMSQERAALHPAKRGALHPAQRGALRDAKRAPEEAVLINTEIHANNRERGT